MDEKTIRSILENIKDGKTDIESAIKLLKNLPYEDIGYAKVDHHRTLRNGYPEVIYCEGKTNEQVRGILERMIANGSCNILATRASKAVYESVKSVSKDVEYHEVARIVSVNKKVIAKSKGMILVVTGGTSDLPVAEEAAVTADVMGNTVERLYDVGVAGIHRLLSKTDLLRQANVIIAVAGMEGALPSVVGGLVDKPVIAVPTSVGYGANFGGLSALLCMLNSCASGIGVVNIDNGFGAGYLAGTINRLAEQ